MDQTGGRNWLLTLAYDGTDYCGWQIQPNDPTVQGLLNHKLARLFRTPLKTYGTSRTDSGVHALGQRVTVEIPQIPDIPPERALTALNKAFPSCIRVLAIDVMPDGFHARKNALGKAYCYVLKRGYCTDPFSGRYSWALPFDVDIELMRQAAASLQGTHDFTAFGAASKNNDTERDPMKTMFSCTLAEHQDLIMFTVVGNSFLFRMVRRLTGFLVSVGKGRLPADAATELYVSGERNAGFDTAPAHGLFLREVFYDDAAMRTYHNDRLPFQALMDR